jgi:hypothetical protein
MNRLRFCVCLLKGHTHDADQQVLETLARTERGDPQRSLECSRCGYELPVDT